MNKRYETTSLYIGDEQFDYIAFKKVPNETDVTTLKEYFEFSTDIDVEEFKSGFKQNLGLHEDVKQFMIEKNLSFSCTIIFDIFFNGGCLIDMLQLIINKKEGDKYYIKFIPVEFKNEQTKEKYKKTKINRIKEIAEQGDTYHQSLLVQMYATGYGVEKNEQKAIDLLAQILGQEQDCVDPSIKEMTEEFKNNAEQGDSMAQYNLAFMYANGCGGVEQDLEKAFYWFKKAAEQGNAVAQYNTANRYKKGEGVEKNLEQAIYWWTEAAKQGYAPAQYNLGITYSIGDGVEVDINKGFFYLMEAEKAGFTPAKHAIDELFLSVKNS